MFKDFVVRPLRRKSDGLRSNLQTQLESGETQSMIFTMR